MVNSQANISVTQYGSVDASFSVPSFEYEMGDNPLVISDDIIMPLDPVTEPDAGNPYMLTADSNLYISDGNGTTGDEDPVTGLEIKTGANVTLPLNSGGTTCSIDFDHSIVIAGIVTTDLNGPVDRGGLSLNSIQGKFMLDSAGAINLDGVDSSLPADGGDGGAFSVAAGSDVVLLGEVNCSGGIGAIGGSATAISLVSQYKSVYVTGALTGNGGNGINDPGIGAGGMGCSISLVAPYGNVYCSSQIIVNGGTSITADGGSGGTFTINAGASATGESEFNGSISSNGGNSQMASGGAGQAVTILTHGGKLLFSGSISAVGGNGGTDASATVGAGGNGGSVTFVISQSTSNASPRQLQPGPVRVSGPITLDGGTGIDNGGAGGNLVLTMSGFVDSMDPPAYPIELVGFGSFDITGGNGATIGGTGGYVVMTTLPSTHLGDAYASGSVSNEASFNMNGGNGGSGDGGAAGYILVNTSPVNKKSATVVNTGAMTMIGGDGDSGGDGGVFQILSSGDISQYGAIDTSGGNGSGAAPASGGDSGTILLSTNTSTSYPDVIFASSIIASGGDGGVGGDATAIQVQSMGNIDFSGTVTAQGGEATGTGAGGQGANLTFANVATTYFNRLTNSASMDFTGGDGASGGQGGGLTVMFNGEVVNSGEIKAPGGASTGTATAAGAGGSIVFQALGYYNLINSGSIIADGGNALGTNSTGGTGGSAIFRATCQVINTGSISLNGGSSTSAVSVAGGHVDMLSGGIEFTENGAPMISVVGGAGATPRVDGQIIIDQVNVTPDDGTLP